MPRMLSEKSDTKDYIHKSKSIFWILLLLGNIITFIIRIKQ